MASESQIRSDERQKVLDCVKRWLDIKNRYHPDRMTTAPDVDHSALLRRLLSGKEPLPEPPPIEYGYPKYPD